MRKYIAISFFIILIIIGVILFVNLNQKNIENNIEEIEKNDFVSYNGWLNVDGTNIKNEKGEIIQLVGVSSHAIQWYGAIINKENIKILKEDWGINALRLAIYTQVDGELVYEESLNERIMQIIDFAIAEDIYVILDWHVLEEKNPNKYKYEAKKFFDTFSKKYANTPNLIYEICNEPNGGTVEWNNDVKPYAEDVIETIRANSEKSLIIVGTPNWCKDFSQVKDNRLEDKNVVYAYHLYSGAEETKISDLEALIQEGIPVFVSEWGITDNTGTGEIYIENANKWVEALNKNNIGWIMWSFSNKDEATAILDYTYYTEKHIDDYLSPTGKYTREIIMKTKGKEIKEENQEDIDEELKNDL